MHGYLSPVCIPFLAINSNSKANADYGSRILIALNLGHSRGIRHATVSSLECMPVFKRFSAAHAMLSLQQADAKTWLLSCHISLTCVEDQLVDAQHML